MGASSKLLMFTLLLMKMGSSAAECDLVAFHFKCCNHYRIKLVLHGGYKSPTGGDLK